MPPGMINPIMITDREEFAHTLTTLRERAGLTIREAVRATGLPRQLPDISPEANLVLIVNR